MTTQFKTVDVDGTEIFYREAGDRSWPTILLLHGFPSSSHMFRGLIPELDVIMSSRLICRALANRP
jgi:pimeloyl-ACP methyl ester carboxylesterase